MRKEYFDNKILEFKHELTILTKKMQRVSALRLGFFLSIFFAIPIYSKLPILLAAFVVVFLIFLFLLSIMKHLSIENEINDRKHLIKIYLNEIDSYNNGINIFGDGSEFIDKNHPYSSDLDIFGKFSLFNKINRTVTFEGIEILSGWLMRPENSLDEIMLRQISATELKKNEKFKEQFLLAYFIDKDIKREKKNIGDWVLSFPQFIELNTFFKYFLIGLSIFMISFAIFSIFISFGKFILIILGLISFILNFRYKNRIDKQHEYASRYNKIFFKSSKLVELVSVTDFKDNYLNELKYRICGDGQFLVELLKIREIINRLDFRLNIFIGPLLNLFFFWDIYQCFRFEKWVKRNKDRIGKWMHELGQIDALLSLSIVEFNKPDWIYPELSTSEELVIEGNNICHPLINDCKPNDYNIYGVSEFDIVTGSNMAGKSTFLRTIGTNVVLALAGSVVNADKFKCSLIYLFTYMRIADSIELGSSTFNAELDRIKRILNYIQNYKPTFLLLDELLRGTNTTDRHTGTKALVRQLIKQGASGIIATHDLGIAVLENEFPFNIRNFNFSIKSVEDELFFDYKLNSGVCSIFNAELLMRKIGISL
jgi:hypothetical protein